MMRIGLVVLLLGSVLTGCYRSTLVREERRLPVMTLDQVGLSLRQGITEAEVTVRLRESRLEPPFENWSADDLVALKQAGASDALIEEMKEASHRAEVEIIERRRIYRRTYSW